jgi:hypothetical protein
MAHSTGSQVRAWATEQGLPVKSGEGVRGRLPNPVIEAFNEAHPRAKYLAASKAPARTVEVKAKPEKGRTVTRKVSPAAVRAWATKEGLTDATKGRLSKETYRLAVLAGVGAKGK